MKKSKFTEEQIAFALKQAESGTDVAHNRSGAERENHRDRMRWQPDPASQLHNAAHVRLGDMGQIAAMAPRQTIQADPRVAGRLDSGIGYHAAYRSCSQLP